MSSDDDHDHDDGKGKAKSRRELPSGAVATLKAWLLSPEHFTHPYPTPQDQIMLMQQTGIDKKQLKNWFTNARRRIWKPMLKKQLEQGKLQATGAGGAAVPGPGVMPSVMVPLPAPAPGADGDEAQSMHSYQGQQLQYDAYGNPIYPQQQPTHPGAPGAQPYGAQYYQQFTAQQDAAGSQAAGMPTSGSIGSLPPITSNPGSFSGTSGMLSKHDSHAVLMELFARDQDLVRQATETRGDKGEQAASQKFGSSTRLSVVPSLNSWPHFSSISSLNNLGSMTGVKSITSLSGADLVSQGGKSSNLAQVKSLESMGKHDSYAFLEVFFGDRASSTNLSGKDQDQGRGVKREREEDNDVGLSLDADESPSVGASMKQNVNGDTSTPGVPQPAPLPAAGKDFVPGSGNLKRAYDDALAARGLISVSRSCERLTDLALPAKIQRTLSQEFIRQQQSKTQYGQYAYAPPDAPAAANPAASANGSQQYPGQQPTQEPSAKAGTPEAADTDASVNNSSVEVPNATKCDLCDKNDVDTQLNPCGHYFHHRCLKPSLQTPMGQPKCPIDNIPIQSALLAVPTDENQQQQNGKSQQPASSSWNGAAPATTTIQTRSAVSAESSGPKA